MKPNAILKSLKIFADLQRSAFSPCCSDVEGCVCVCDTQLKAQQTFNQTASKTMVPRWVLKCCIKGKGNFKKKTQKNNNCSVRSLEPPKPGKHNQSKFHWVVVSVSFIPTADWKQWLSPLKSPTVTDGWYYVTRLLTERFCFCSFSHLHLCCYFCCASKILFWNQKLCPPFLRTCNNNIWPS